MFLNVLKTLLFLLNAACLGGEATNTNFIVFGFTRPGLESMIYSTWGEHANHYATDAVYQVWYNILCIAQFQVSWNRWNENYLQCYVKLKCTYIRNKILCNYNSTMIDLWFELFGWILKNPMAQTHRNKDGDHAMWNLCRESQRCLHSCKR